MAVPRALAAMERMALPPPRPRRDKYALCEVACPGALEAGLRPAVRQAPGPRNRFERLCFDQHNRREGCGVGPSGEGETPWPSDLCERPLEANF